MGISPLAAVWGHGLLGFVFTAGGPRILLPRPCRVLVLLNPRGGKGKGLQLFRSHVQPLLVQADISFTLMLTGECLPEGVQGASPARDLPTPTLMATLSLPDRRNHARELVRAEDLRLWDALVIMSGDGLMHEVRPAPGGWAGAGAGPGPRGGAEATCAPTGGERAHGAAGLGDRHAEAPV